MAWTKQPPGETADVEICLLEIMGERRYVMRPSSSHLVKAVRAGDRDSALELLRRLASKLRDNETLDHIESQWLANALGAFTTERERACAFLGLPPSKGRPSGKSKLKPDPSIGSLVAQVKARGFPVEDAGRTTKKNKGLEGGLTIVSRLCERPRSAVKRDYTAYKARQKKAKDVAESLSVAGAIARWMMNDWFAEHEDAQ